jgi:transcriptional regulator with XRE-family HTH domain
LAYLNLQMKDQDSISAIEQHVIDYVIDLREKHDLTQDDLANIMHLSRSFVKNALSPNHRAKFNLRHINALADYFNISPREFIPEKAIPVNSASSKVKPKKAASKKKSVSKSAPAKTARKKS